MNARLAICVVLIPLLLPIPAQACSCIWAGPFLKVAPGTELIVRAKVLAYHGKSRDVDLAMDVQVLEVLKGTTPSRKIRIWGDDGVMCRPYVKNFPLQTEWVFAIRKLTGEGSAAGDYFISVCGEYWARVENGGVSGRLSAPDPPAVNDKPETMSLTELRARLGVNAR
jgi:hypothetical protein